MQTLLTPDRAQSLLAMLASTRSLAGCVVEMGVYRGGMLEAMARACPEKTCYGFDTFEGQPAASWLPGDFHRPGEFGDTSYEAVKAAMPANVILKRGRFPESANGLRDCVSFAHVDFDLEQSTQDAIEWLLPRMVPGGVIVFDDWHWPHCEGVDRAIQRAGLNVIDSAAYQCFWKAPTA